jgi:MEDS: MEthanogen/methylotroph, DcmR Sensory domain
MAADSKRAADPVAFGGGMLDQYRHVCAFARWQGALDSVLDPFIRDGIATGDRLIYLVDPAESGAPINRLRHLGYDAGELLAQHRCEVRTWADTYLSGGDFDQSQMLDQLDGLLLGDSPSQIRMMCDMGWAADRSDVSDHLIEFEARANFIHARHEHVVICSYDETKFDGAFIIDVLRTHPMVLIGGMLQENPFFVPPAEFLKERGLDGPR